MARTDILAQNMLFEGMEDVLKKISYAAIICVLLFSQHVLALNCLSVVGVDKGPKSAHQKVRARAEKFASKKQKSKSVMGLRKKFYRAMTKLLLRRNLGANRISEESTRDVYNETVTKVKALLGQSLITDAEISSLRESIKLDSEKLQPIEAEVSKLEKEVKVLTAELNNMGVTKEGKAEKPNLVFLTRGEQKIREAKVASKKEELAGKKEELTAAVRTRDELIGSIKERTESSQKRRELRIELTKSIKDDRLAYDALPAKIQDLIEKIEVRSQRIAILEDVDSLTPQKVRVPEHVNGSIVWKVESYDGARAREEVAFLNKQIKERVLKKQIKVLLSQQADLFKKLTIYKDYFLDAQLHSPETFGPFKQKMLSRILNSLENPDSFPGYTALKGFERKIFIEEFMEAFNIAGGAEPKTVLLKKLTDQGLAVKADFQEGIGAVKNSVVKQVRATVMALVVSSASITGVGFAVPDDAGSVLSGPIKASVSVASNVVSSALFKLDSITSYHATAKKLTQIPEAERQAWLFGLAESNNIDVTTKDGAAVIREIIREARVIELGAEKAAAERAALEADQRAALGSLFEELD